VVGGDVDVVDVVGGTVVVLVELVVVTDGGADVVVEVLVVLVGTVVVVVGGVLVVGTIVVVVVVASVVGAVLDVGGALVVALESPSGGSPAAPDGGAHSPIPSAMVAIVAIVRWSARFRACCRSICRLVSSARRSGDRDGRRSQFIVVYRRQPERIRPPRRYRFRPGAAGAYLGLPVCGRPRGWPVLCPRWPTRAHPTMVVAATSSSPSTSARTSSRPDSSPLAAN